MHNSCSVCLKNENLLVKISDTDVNDIQLFIKLTECVPEVEWSENQYICNTCTEQLQIVYNFRQLCINSYTTRKQLKLNEEYIIKTEVFICYHCNASYDYKNDLIKHINIHNSNETKDNINIKKRRSTRIKQFTCELCPKIFKTSKKLIEHGVNEHELKSNTIKPFKCNKCGNRFTSSSNLVQHNKYHEGNRTHICSYCGKGFITTSDLINHEKQHLNKREYKCILCCKGFNTHKDLRSHNIVKHKDPNTWNYKCNICNKPFHIKPNYENHMRRHYGDKRFVCLMCEKAFITKDELRKHMKSHTNIRGYKCNVCDKEYKEKRVLDIHLAKIHCIGNAKIPVRIRKHLCNICAKSFYDKNKLLRHMFTHSGERPYSCEICGKKFTDKSYVKQHLKCSHNVYEESKII